MGAQSDKVAGKAEQAAGIVTGNEDLEAEGRSERHSADIKKKIEDVLDTAEAKVEAVVDKTKDVLHRHR